MRSVFIMAVILMAPTMKPSAQSCGLDEPCKSSQLNSCASYQKYCKALQLPWAPDAVPAHPMRDPRHSTASDAGFRAV